MRNTAPIEAAHCDILIIGAGVAGLSAAAALTADGKDVRCLEANNRIGGRIFTVHDPQAPVAIELGAEFVHGRPPEVWDIIRGAKITTVEHTARALHLQNGRVSLEQDVGEPADQILSQVAKSARQPDRTFEYYLRHSRRSADTKDWARIHVEGFNAARSDLISAASLVQDTKAAERIDGDRSFCIVAGYDAVPTVLLQSIPDYRSVVQLNSIVESLNWRRGSVEVQYRSAVDGQRRVIRCYRVIVTIPLGVLQTSAPNSGAIRFDPEPGHILRAVASLQFGQVYRVTLRFREAFWEDDERLKGFGYLISKDREFFAWWSRHPVISPLLTAWMAGTAAERFVVSDSAQVASAATASLARTLKRKLPPVEAFYVHDWRRDPFFRGAYSYVPVNSLGARKALAMPVESTLFFAGEAANLDGHGATVHGAIASGLRAARLVQQSLSRSR